MLAQAACLRCPTWRDWAKPSASGLLDPGLNYGKAGVATGACGPLQGAKGYLLWIANGDYSTARSRGAKPSTDGRAERESDAQVAGRPAGSPARA